MRRRLVVERKGAGGLKSSGALLVRTLWLVSLGSTAGRWA